MSGSEAYRKAEASVAIDGRWFPVGQSGAWSAVLSVAPDGSAELALAGELPRAVKIAKVSDRIGTVERRIELADGSVFTTADNDAVDAMPAARATGWFSPFSRVSGLEAFHPRLILFVAAAVALVFLVVRDGVPLASWAAAKVTPQVVSDTLDASGLQTLEQIVLEDTALPEERQAAIRAGWDDIRGERDYRLLFKGGGRLGPNALALPGGTIIVTDELVELMRDDEIVAVLGHEIAHVDEDHSLQSIYRAAGIAAVAMLVIGDPGPVLDQVVGGGGLLLAMRGSRAMETEADTVGARVLSEAGRDPAALASALEKLMRASCVGGRCKEAGWLDSHPGGDERLERLRDVVEGLEKLEG